MTETYFTELFAEYSPKILKVCLGFTGDKVLAEDLAQETFIKVWQNLRNYRGEASPGTWIYKIAVNTSLAHLRSKKKESVVELPETIANKPDETSFADHKIEVLYKAISRLSEIDGLIISMVLENISYEEISDAIGISQANLRVKIHRIKKELTNIYNQYERV